MRGWNNWDRAGLLFCLLALALLIWSQYRLWERLLPLLLPAR